MTQYKIPIKDVNGGISESKYKGIEGSFYRSVGTDIWTTLGVIKAGQKPTKDSGATCVDFPKYAILGKDGHTYWFGNAGRAYKRTSAGTWSQVYNDTNSAEIVGAGEHNGFYYWATAANSYKCPVASSDWATDATATAFTNGTAPHPHKAHLTKLYIGDGKDVVEVSDVTSSVLDLHPDFTVQILESYGIDLLVGARVANTNRSGIFRWNCVDDSWNFEDFVNEDGINCIIVDNFSNDVIISAGSMGNLYNYNGYALNFKRKIPGEYNATTGNIVHYQSMANFGDKVLIGVSDVSTTNAALEGIYAYKNYDYPILNLDYVISPDKTASIEVGAILVDGQDIFFSWKDSSTYGVDKVDWSNKYQSAYVETMIMQPFRTQEKFFREFKVACDALTANTAIDVSYMKDEDTSYTTVNGSPIDTDDTVLQTLYDEIEASKIQVKLAFDVKGSISPEIEAVDIGYDLLKKPK